MTRTCLILGLLFPQLAAAYPQFIGYKYSSCITCHYNSHGNGPINDYGRSLWSAEIAGRLWSGGKTEEQLSESSGFLGSTQLPWWIRPGVKSRYLYLQTRPGNPSSDSRSILMQADANVALFFDKDQKLSVVGSVGYVPEPLRFQNTSQEVDTIISREHYVRWQAQENLWLYFGMLDKVYGLRIINHNAYSRSRTGLAQNDQAHSLIAHYIKENWEWTVDLFGGNLYQDTELRQKGLSTMFEYDLKPSWRVGGSLLISSNDFIDNQRFAVHSKYGFGYGSALLFELGNIKDSPQNAASKNGYYAYSEIQQKVVRGYHAFLIGQLYKDDMTGSRPDNVKMGLGMLAFPMARMEVRIEVENTRQIYNGAQAPEDVWAILAQIHASL